MELLEPNNEYPLAIIRMVRGGINMIDLRRMEYAKDGHLMHTKHGVLLSIDDGMARDTLQAMLTLDGKPIPVHNGKLTVATDRHKEQLVIRLQQSYKGVPSKYHHITLYQDTAVEVTQILAKVLGEIIPEPEPLPGNNGDPKLAARLRQWIVRLESDIENKRLPSTLSPTPKRLKQHQQRLHDAANLERAMWAMEGLASAHENNDVPEGLLTMHTKKDILAATCTKSVSGLGYYEHEDSRVFIDTSPAAVLLQQYVLAREDPAAGEKAEISKLESQARLKVGQIPGFFPTPPNIVITLMGYADVRAGMHVLEPSAGRGDIADAIRAIGVMPDVCEVNYFLAGILEKKGYQLVARDFTESAKSNSKRYACIVMNPPFEKGADMNHVRLAYNLLEHGGRLVSVMSQGIQYNSGKKYRDFQEWLSLKDGYFEPLPDMAFAASGTKVATVVLIMNK